MSGLPARTSGRRCSQNKLYEVIILKPESLLLWDLGSLGAAARTGAATVSIHTSLNGFWSTMAALHVIHAVSVPRTWLRTGAVIPQKTCPRQDSDKTLLTSGQCDLDV